MADMTMMAQYDLEDAGEQEGTTAEESRERIRARISEQDLDRLFDELDAV